MKVLLLQPPVRDFYDTPQRLQPLGLCSLKAALTREVRSCEVAVRDYHHAGGRRTVALPPELADLRAFYPAPDRSPFSTFHAYSHYGVPYEDLAQDVAGWAPDLVGISAAFTAYHREALRCAEAVKARVHVPIVVGGSHASAVPEAVLAHPAVDYVIRGEGERPLVELVRALRDGGSLDGVSNLAWRRGGRPCLNPMAPNYPLAELPIPDFSDLPVERYRLGKRPLATLLTSRGCPHRCRFCAAGAVFGHGYRRRPVPDVVAEIRLRYTQGYRAFDFEDDNLTLPRKEMVSLCRELSTAFEPGEILLHAMNGVAYLALDPERVEWMARAGFRHLNLSLVSLDPRVCKRMGRASDPQRFAKIVGAAHRWGLGCVGYQILGLPGESVESMSRTLAFLARLPLLIGASPFYRPPGSPLTAGSPGDASTWVRCRLTAMGCDRRESVYTLFVAARILNFLKSLAMESPRVSLSDALSVARGRGGRSEVGAELLEQVLEGGPLCAASPAGPVPLPMFRSDLFRRLWQGLDEVTTQAGACIRLR